MKIFELKDTNEPATFSNEQIECQGGIQLSEDTKLFLDVNVCGDGHELTIVLRSPDPNSPIEDVYVPCDQVFYWPQSLAQNVAVTAEGLFGRMGHVSDAITHFMALALVVGTTLVIELEKDQETVGFGLCNEKFSCDGTMPIKNLANFLTVMKKDCNEGEIDDEINDYRQVVE